MPTAPGPKGQGVLLPLVAKQGQWADRDSRGLCVPGPGSRISPATSQLQVLQQSRGQVLQSPMTHPRPWGSGTQPGSYEATCLSTETPGHLEASETEARGGLETLGEGVGDSRDVPEGAGARRVRP